MSKKIFGIIVVLSFVLLLSACQKNSKESGIAPLTGLEVESGTNDRIKSVMVNNHTKARPQSGLSKADLVFEILAEGDITRFLAMYQSEQPEIVGPVRSAREYYFNLADNYGALYVYHGAANFVDKMIQDENIDYINGAMHDDDGVLFERSSDRKAPHNSYLQFSSIKKEAKEQRYDLEKAYKPLPFKKKDEDSEGSEASYIKINYSNTVDAYNPEYRYNKSGNMYTRYAGGEQTIEKEDAISIEVQNVFVIEAEHEVFDDDGRRKIDLESGGTAYLFQQGKMQTLEWESKNGMIIPVKNGVDIGFFPGKTWINVIPTDPGIGLSVTVAND